MVFDFDNFDPKRLVGIINQYGVTSFCAPPTVYRYLVKKGIPPCPPSGTRPPRESSCTRRFSAGSPRAPVCR